MITEKRIIGMLCGSLSPNDIHNINILKFDFSCPLTLADTHIEDNRNGQVSLNSCFFLQLLHRWNTFKPKSANVYHDLSVLKMVFFCIYSRGDNSG